MTIRELTREVFEDPAYKASLISRAQAGTLPIEIEMLLLENFEVAPKPVQMRAALGWPKEQT